MSGVYGKSIEKINEGVGADLALMGVVVAFVAIREGIRAFKKKKAEKKRKFEEEEKKKRTVQNPEWIKRRDKVGDELQRRLVQYLKDFVKKNKFDEIYKDSACSYLVACDIKADNMYSNFGVSISEFQSGWADEMDPTWAKKHKDYKVKEEWTEDPVYNNEWYYDLLEEGKDKALEIFRSIPGNEEFEIYVSTGDGDEGLIYIDIDEK